jgi:hypothetical protein
MSESFPDDKAALRARIKAEALRRAGRNLAEWEVDSRVKDHEAREARDRRDGDFRKDFDALCGAGAFVFQDSAYRHADELRRSRFYTGTAADLEDRVVGLLRSVRLDEVDFAWSDKDPGVLLFRVAMPAAHEHVIGEMGRESLYVFHVGRSGGGQWPASK